MPIDKQQVLDLIGQQGSPQQLALAELQLPTQVDLTQYAGMLQGFGLDAQGIAELIPGSVDAQALVDQVAGGDVGQAQGVLGDVLGFLGR